MGLIKAALGAAGGVLADQWKEFFTCDAMGSDVLAVRGKKRTSGRSSNTRGSDNVISDGSVIAVADGQCAMIVDQGKVAEFCAEPGEYRYDASSEPSVFSGDLGESLLETFRAIGRRFSFGGDTGKDQRVYYFNIKEILDNRFGTPSPVPFRVVDENIGLDMDITVRCNGVYSYRIVNPILFYTNVCGNVREIFTRSELDAMLKSEFLTALQPAFARISAMGIRYSALPGHTVELADAMNEALTKKWRETRGIAVVSVALNSISAPKEDEDLIKSLQRTAVMRDPGMAAAALTGAQADAMRTAAGNSAGAMTGFLGMNMAAQTGGGNAESLYTMAAKREKKADPHPLKPQADGASEKGTQGKDGEDGSWTCACGTVTKGKFCPECGAKRPEKGWTCACGTVNQGKFCTECGAKKPSGVPQYRCDRCGWQPEDPAHPPKFCPECGDPFGDEDRV